MMDTIGPIVEKVQAFKDVVEEDSEASIVVDDDSKSYFQEKEIELKAKREEKKAIEDRTLVLEGSSLQETITTKIDKKTYEDNLGIVHKVKRDLDLISESMLRVGTEDDDIFPRGDPRIVLFVDDLDRCPPELVVEVIEALQLLVKTKLFVVVLAIDPRYVCLSLEKYYKGVLNHRTPPSGMDFLEKIVQIPFRLPGVGHDKVTSLVYSQLEMEPESTDPNDVSAGGSTEKKANLKEESKVNPPEAREQQAELQVEPEAKSQVELQVEPEAKPQVEPQNEVLQEGTQSVEPKVQDDLPMIKVYFTKEERDMMVEVFELLPVAPRSMRRIINVFKVLKVVWEGDTNPEININLKRATLFLMLLSANESTRQVTHNIYEWMEMGSVKYHQVEDKGNLADLFTAELRRQNKSYEKSFPKDGTSSSAKEGTLLFHVQTYLKEYTWTDFDSWQKIATKFLLARSFSFFRLSNDEIDKVPQFPVLDDVDNSGTTSATARGRSSG